MTKLINYLLGIITGVALIIIISYRAQIQEAWNHAMLCKHDGTLTGINKDRTWFVDISKWTGDLGDSCFIKVCKDCGKILDIETWGRGSYSNWPVEGARIWWGEEPKEIHTCTSEELEIFKKKSELLDIINANLKNGTNIQLVPEVEGAGFNVIEIDGTLKAEIKGIQFSSGHLEEFTK